MQSICDSTFCLLADVFNIIVNTYIIVFTEPKSFLAIAH